MHYTFVEITQAIDNHQVFMSQAENKGVLNFRSGNGTELQDCVDSRAISLEREMTSD